MDIFLVVIFGLVIGSFLNVCICRIANEESIAFPPSHCTNCGYELKAKDLIPVLSYIFLGGKCRSCKEKISIQYPIVEILNAILYIATMHGCIVQQAVAKSNQSSMMDASMSTCINHFCNFLLMTFLFYL